MSLNGTSWASLRPELLLPCFPSPVGCRTRPRTGGGGWLDSAAAPIGRGSCFLTTSFAADDQSLPFFLSHPRFAGYADQIKSAKRMASITSMLPASVTGGLDAASPATRFARVEEIARALSQEEKASGSLTTEGVDKVVKELNSSVAEARPCGLVGFGCGCASWR